MAHRSPARWLAPLALVAFLVALVMVIGGSGGSDDVERSNEPAAPATQTTSGDGDGGGSRERRARKTYTVKLGDTPSQIASENDITLEQLLKLNPDLDPQLLTPGDKLRIRK